jgi:hypothetical protein
VLRKGWNGEASFLHAFELYVCYPLQKPLYLGILWNRFFAEEVSEINAGKCGLCLLRASLRAGGHQSLSGHSHAFPTPQPLSRCSSRFSLQDSAWRAYIAMSSDLGPNILTLPLQPVLTGGG